MDLGLRAGDLHACGGDGGIGRIGLRLHRGNRGFGAARASTVVVQRLHRGCTFLCQGLRTCQPALGSVELGLGLAHPGQLGRLVALAHDHLGLRAGDGGQGLLALGLGLAQLRVQRLHLHGGQHLACLYEGSFADQDIVDAPCQLGRHVDFGRLDAAVAVQ